VVTSGCAVILLSIGIWIVYSARRNQWQVALCVILSESMLVVSRDACNPVFKWTDFVIGMLCLKVATKLDLLNAAYQNYRTNI